MNKIDNREIKINKEKKKDDYNDDSEPEDDDRAMRPIGSFDNIINKIEKDGLSEENIAQLIDQGIGAYDTSVEETDYTSSGCLS